MERMSNRDRIARAAEEARLTALEKQTKKADKAAPGARPKRAAPAARVKIVWEVATESGKTVETFSYPDKPAAEARAAHLTQSTGRTHAVRPAKVPME